MPGMYKLYKMEKGLEAYVWQSDMSFYYLITGTNVDAINKHIDYLFDEYPTAGYGTSIQTRQQDNKGIKVVIWRSHSSD